MEYKPLLSIIIPAYNAEKHIGRCLDSILRSLSIVSPKTMSPVEILVVNDGSVDNTTEKVNVYIKDFGGALVLINKENNGVSSARNRGIENAKGEYLYFMDSDDEISLDFFDKVLQKLEQNNSDIFFFGFKIVSEKGIRCYLPQNVPNMLNQFLLGNQKIAIWSIICKKEIYNCIKFDEDTYYAEDIEVISKILFLTKKREVIEEALYVYYLDNPSSAMNRKLSKKNLTSIAAHQRIYTFLKDHGAEKIVLRSASNLLLSRYYLWKQKVLESKDNELYSNLSEFEPLNEIIPSFQFNKYYIYNLINYCKYHFFSIKKDS